MAKNVMEIINAGADVNHVFTGGEAHGYKPIDVALLRSKCSIISILVDKGALTITPSILDIRDDMGNTILHHLASQDSCMSVIPIAVNIGLVKLLNVKNVLGETPIQVFIEKYHGGFNDGMVVRVSNFLQQRASNFH